MKILVIGDIVGKGGRRAVIRRVSELRREFGCDYCIANGENIAGGSGMTGATLNELKECGVDVVTSGDHVWKQRGFTEEINRLPYVLRPANYGPQQPGKGYDIFNIPSGGSICVINLIGRIFMSTPSNCPFQEADRILKEVKGRTDLIVVDFHAEATSEKTALAHYLDGRVSVVFGTHTHVATADERLLPKGTAYITDVGMVGSRTSVIGRDIEAVTNHFATGLPFHFTVAEKDIEVNAIVVDVDARTGVASSIQRVTR